MYKLFILPLAIFSILVASAFTNENSSTYQSPIENYKTYCAGCHGEKLESFANRKYKNGDSDKAIYNVIKNGLTNAGMPSYTATFNDKEIEELTAYIKSAAAIAYPKSEEKTIYNSEVVTLKIDTITTLVNVPWAMEFLADNTMLITDRDGDFYHRYNDGKMVKISNVPIVHAEGQGGLLDVALHPDFDKNNVIYLSYSKPVKKDGQNMSTTAVARAVLDKDALTDVREIFEARPYFQTNHHYGSRLLFDKQGYLYVSVGERGKENLNPQDLSSECGKVHRLMDDGRIPDDNPYLGDMKAAPSIYSYGHRNPQGMDINPTTGEIWENEHGPKGGDEINIIKPKANFGWPLTTFGINYNGTKITDNTTLPGITDPIHFWVPSIGPGDGTFVTSELYGAWKGDFMVASLSFGFLNRCIVKDNKVVRNEKLLEGIGRMRSVKQGRDGFIYIGLENPGRIMRVRPLW
jgi:aldose sugar dehydrogenase